MREWVPSTVASTSPLLRRLCSCVFAAPQTHACCPPKAWLCPQLLVLWCKATVGVPSVLGCQVGWQSCGCTPIICRHILLPCWTMALLLHFAKPGAKAIARVFMNSHSSCGGCRAAGTCGGGGGSKRARS
ncbi:hypothetical protein DUNSADRAFT_4545 [Dunaliella salina]|uniref:Encoded protein n=1 Tax=Dunaliella salina TaxID=3046 RepID=A0ABQ7FUR7_DUNSA|nr:hypothetical protein DUNSADRAFT_4545 [Dunaliella salina]|eukprot:KAF5826149.1 hypothetical protein DUNSADRAFT_4545 [Dunaliella salina]